MDEDEDDILARALEVLQRRAAKRTTAQALTVGQLFERYESSQQHRKSWRAFKVKLAPFVAAHAAREASSLAVMDWTLYATSRLAALAPPKFLHTYSVGTVNVELGTVKAWLNWATAQGLLRFNPLAAAKRMKNRKGRETAPTERENGRFLQACQDDRERVLILAAADVGLRINEIRNLRHDWIDAERKTIALPSWACKGGRGGVVPCTQRFLDAVAALPRHFSFPQVLYSERARGSYSRQHLARIWDGIRARAGVEAAPGDGAVHLHDLRAGAATNALDRGVRLETVSRRILRHSSIATTEVYLRGRNVGDLDQAIAAMEAGIVRDQNRRR